MKLIRYKHSLLIYALIAMQIYFLTSCNTKSYNSKHQVEKIGFLGFYLDMDYLKVKSIMDSLLNMSELCYVETTDAPGNKQKNLYHDFSGISPFLCAKVNLRGNYIIYFDSGYPESLTNSDNPIKKSDVPELSDSTSTPIIYYDFTQEHIDRLLEKASRIKEKEFK